MTTASKKVRAMFSGLGTPPTAQQAVGVLQVPHVAPTKTEPMVQLNLRVPKSDKRRVRLLAARDSLSLSDVMLKGLDLYEEKFGPAPEL